MDKNNFIIIFSTVAMAAICVFQSFEIIRAKDKINAYESQIHVLEIQSQEDTARYVAARNEAETSLKAAKKKQSQLLHSKIPQDCMGAISWAAKQAENLS